MSTPADLTGSADRPGPGGTAMTTDPSPQEAADPLAAFPHLTGDEREWITDSTLVDMHLPCTYYTPDGPCSHTPTRMFKEGRRCRLDAPQAYRTLPEGT